MKEKTFQYMVLGFLVVLLVVALISLFGKKTNQMGQSRISMFGKTLWQEKEATATAKTDEKKAA